MRIPAIIICGILALVLAAGCADSNTLGIGETLQLDDGTSLTLTYAARRAPEGVDQSPGVWLVFERIDPNAQLSLQSTFTYARAWTSEGKPVKVASLSARHADSDAWGPTYGQPSAESDTIQYLLNVWAVDVPTRVTIDYSPLGCSSVDVDVSE